jgi:enoyl-CoA hydratase
MPETIQIERDGRTMAVRIDRPPHNFMNRHMVAELDELTRDLERDETIGSVVITGGVEGKFLTHYDVEEILAGAEGVGRELSAGLAGASLRTAGELSRIPGVGDVLGGTPAAGLLELRAIHELFLRMNRMNKVFIAAINGPALGGGCELSLACDIRYMADDAGAIGLPEMTLGFNPGAGGTQRMARILGPALALETILEARALSPEEALDMGLVHRVVKGKELLDEARVAAARLARRSPHSVAGLKQAIYEGGSRSLPDGMAVERKWFMSGASTRASRRAMRAYGDQIARDGVPPWATEEGIVTWREGTAVDLISG